jgi:ADP-heptose:LPS heptosyltransferase
MLLVRPDHIGDVLLTSPAIRLLRESLPNARLTYLVGPWSVEAARRGPPVDEVCTLAFPGFTRRTKPNALQPYALLLREALNLRREQYDLAAIFRPDHWWGALLALVAGIPLRIGAATPETTQLLTHARVPRVDEHAAVQALEVAQLALRAAGITAAAAAHEVVFSVPEQARQQAEAWWQQHGLQGRRVTIVQPSAGAVLKSWPIRRWANLLDALPEPVVLSGAPADARLLDAITERTADKPFVAVGQSLEVSAALYARAALVIAPDSAAGHLAAAVGTPSLRLYGPAPVTTFGPWPNDANQQILQSTKLACVPCGYLENPPCGARTEPACMLAIAVEDVVQQAKTMLARSQN